MADETTATVPQEGAWKAWLGGRGDFPLTSGQKSEASTAPKPIVPETVQQMGTAAGQTVSPQYTAQPDPRANALYSTADLERTGQRMEAFGNFLTAGRRATSEGLAQIAANEASARGEAPKLPTAYSPEGFPYTPVTPGAGRPAGAGVPLPITPSPETAAAVPAPKAPVAPPVIAPATAVPKPAAAAAPKATPAATAAAATTPEKKIDSTAVPPELAKKYGFEVDKDGNIDVAKTQSSNLEYATRINAMIGKDPNATPEDKATAALMQKSVDFALVQSMKRPGEKAMEYLKDTGLDKQIVDILANPEKYMSREVTTSGRRATGEVRQAYKGEPFQVMANFTETVKTGGMPNVLTDIFTAMNTALGKGDTESAALLKGYTDRLAAAEKARSENLATALKAGTIDVNKAQETLGLERRQVGANLSAEEQARIKAEADVKSAQLGKEGLIGAAKEKGETTGVGKVSAQDQLLRDRQERFMKALGEARASVGWPRDPAKAAAAEEALWAASGRGLAEPGGTAAPKAAPVMGPAAKAAMANKKTVLHKVINGQAVYVWEDPSAPNGVAIEPIQ